MHQKTKSEQLEEKRQSLAAECQNVKPGDMQKLAVEIAMAQLEAQIAILQKIEANAMR